MARLIDRVQCDSIKEMIMARWFVRGINKSRTPRRRVFIIPPVAVAIVLASAHYWHALIDLLSHLR